MQTISEMDNESHRVEKEFAAIIKHEGLHAYRLKPDQNNSREVAFAKRWSAENSSDFTDHVLAALLVRRTVSGKVEKLAPLDQHAASVAATVVQWLGSNVGMSFLEMALRDCGFDIVRRKG